MAQHPALARPRPEALGALVAAVLAALLVTMLPGAAAGAAVSATALVLSAPGKGVVDTERTVTATLTRDDTGAPLAGAQVRFERRVNGDWGVLATATTDGGGRAEAELRVRPDRADNVVRAVFDGTADLAASQSEEGVVEPHKRPTTITIDGPRRIVDETEVRLTFEWVARNGDPVPGAAEVRRRLTGGDWKVVERVTFNARGRARLMVDPRKDSRWQVVGEEGRWHEGAVSDVHKLNNVPPGDKVRYPAAAPRPRVDLPRQGRAKGKGPNADVSRISDRVWRSMTGVSWHEGCPVGRGELRLVRVNYWGYDGYRYRGELVVRDDIARKTAAVFSDLYRADMPVRAMYRVDRFGWHGGLGGADNYASMASGNTSAFNCRGVVGNPGTRSPHSSGRAIDINTWENPYRSATGVVPNTWWMDRSHPRIAWRSSSHKMVRIMRANGFRWTYGRDDNHHFDG